MFPSIPKDEIFQAELSNIENIINLFNMQVREVIWKWDVLDSSKDYPLLNSDDFISNYPAIWQKLSNIENIINLINYANEWRNLKTKCMLHNYCLYSMDLRFRRRKRNSAPILPWKNRAHSYANEAEYETFVLVKIIANHPKYLSWKYWNDRPSNY
jgi:hypothetical protein